MPAPLLLTTIVKCTVSVELTVSPPILLIVRLGASTVYLTTGTKQSIAVWFKGRYLFVLATRADYDEPRTLLRKALEIQP